MSVTSIEWTKRPNTIGETWNPTTGCNKVDRGCKNCYAEIMHKRLQAMGQVKYQQDFLKGAVCHPDTLNIPMKWTKPRTVFVNSMSDLFHINVPFDFIAEVFQVIQLTPQHTYLVLTKRPDRAVEFWNWMVKKNNGFTPPKNLWMGTSANDQQSGNKRIPELLNLWGCLLFLSYEPATGPLSLERMNVDFNPGPGFLNAFRGESYVDGRLFKKYGNRLSWIICGGESGSKAVPMNPDWARNIQKECAKSYTPFFFKQFGLWQPFDFEMEAGKKYNVKRFLDGRPPMYKARDKGFNILDGKVYQQFPQR